MQLHGFLSEKNSQKKRKKRLTPGWTDISGPDPVSFLSRSSMYYIMLTPHNPIYPLNAVNTNRFSWAYNLQMAETCPINNFNQNPFAFSPSWQE